MKIVLISFQNSIARWMKTVLAPAGVDTDQFKAHSARYAAASAAKSAGVSLKDIMTMADWSRENTFTRFYYEPVGKTVWSSSSQYTCILKVRTLFVALKDTVMYAGLPRHGIEGLTRISMICCATRIP